MKLQFSTIAAAAVLSLSSAVAWGHFGIVIPEHSAVLEQKDANVHFTIAFAHPMERNGMTMAKPDAFYVSFWLTASPRQGLTSRWSTLIATANTRLPMTTLSLRS